MLAAKIPDLIVWRTNDSTSWRGNQNSLLFNANYTQKEVHIDVMQVVGV